MAITTTQRYDTLLKIVAGHMTRDLNDLGYRPVTVTTEAWHDMSERFLNIGCRVIMNGREARAAIPLEYNSDDWSGVAYKLLRKVLASPEFEVAKALGVLET